MIKTKSRNDGCYIKNIILSPMSGCLFSMIQLPLFIAFFEAVQRTPAIFEDKFLGLQLGTTPVVGFGTSGIISLYNINAFNSRNDFLFI